MILGYYGNMFLYTVYLNLCILFIYTADQKFGISKIVYVF